MKMRRPAGKRALALASMSLTIFSAARVLVLFLEAVATVKDERNADLELLELCRRGDAKGSLKMRSACLSAQTDQASPIVLKATVRAFSTAWMEFASTVSSPFGFATMCMFCLSSFVLPTLSWSRAIVSALTAASGDADGADGTDDDVLDVSSKVDTHHVLVIDPRDAGGGLRRRFARLALPMRSAQAEGVDVLDLSSA